MGIETYFKDIADAIRAKAGTSGLITPAQMPAAVAAIPAGGSSFVEPSYSGLSYAYISSTGAFTSGNTQTRCINLFPVLANTRYVVFGDKLNLTRFRAAFYAGKNYSDFQNYVENSNSDRTIYSADTLINGSESYINNAYFITPQNDGMIGIVTNVSSQICPAYCVIMQN